MASHLASRVFSAQRRPSRYQPSYGFIQSIFSASTIERQRTRLADRVSYLMATTENILQRFVYNTTNQISYTVRDITSHMKRAVQHFGRDITSHMRRAWASVCRARWCHAEQKPMLEEYLSNNRAAMTGPILLPDYFLPQNEEQAIQQLQSQSHIINLS
ncbi:(-)-alpha-terpineol synthase-like [Nymphaea colorata]|nr:(-)-alpha-terpineol synthase-like [Nymphaea colorata]